MKKYLYKFTRGSYDDYEEMFYWHDELMTASEACQLLSRNCDEMERVKDARHKEQYDECEALFGIRAWPWSGGFLGARNEDKFCEWRDKWLVQGNKQRILFELAGFEPINENVQIYLGDYFSFYDNDIKAQLANK